MTHIVSFGGGWTSILLALKVIEMYGKDQTEIIQAMVADDPDEVHENARLVEKLTGKQIIRLAWAGKSPYVIDPDDNSIPSIWDVFFAEAYLGSSLADPCSRQLKRGTIKDFIQNTTGTAQLSMWG